MNRAEIEQQVLGMLRHLAGNDPDRAGERNDIGFNGRDTDFGHSLAERSSLSDKQIESALRMLGIYGKTQLAPAGFDHPAVVKAWTERARAPMAPTATPARREWQDEDSFNGMEEPHVGSAVGPGMPTAEVSQERSARYLLGPTGPIATSLPGYEPREAQLIMADSCERAAQNDTNLVVEAPTGTGKSLAYLIPIIASGKKAIISTADKGLQEQIARKDVPFLQEHLGIPFKAAVLKGRANYVCRLRVRDIVEGAEADGKQGSMNLGDELTLPDKDTYEALPEFLDWVDDTETGDIESYPGGLNRNLAQAVTVSTDECIGKKCPCYDICFAEAAKDRAKRANVVIVNHSLLMRDLQIRFTTDGYASVLPDTDIIVLDEAHHLEDQATDAFDQEVSSGQWKRLHAGIQRLLKIDSNRARVLDGETVETEASVNAQRIAALCIALDAKIEEFIASISSRMGNSTTMRLGDEMALAGPAIEVLVALNELMEDATPPHLPEPEREQWGKLCKRVQNFAYNLEAAATPGSLNIVRYAEKVNFSRGGSVMHVHAKPIDIADPLRKRLWEVPMRRKVRSKDDVFDEHDDDVEREPVTVICTSATIAAKGGMDYWRKRVGLDEARDLIVPSPFDFRHNCLLYIPSDVDALNPKNTHTVSTESIAYFDTLANEMERLCTAAEGRAFLLFTSTNALNQVYDRLVTRFAAKHLVLRQGQAPRPELIERFKTDGHAILFGLKSFWEGVDVQGEALSLVVLDKLPFTPPNDPVFQAREERMKARGENPFMDLMLPYSIIALKQGVGRLIRSKTDRGIIAILDTRLHTARYGPVIVKSLPPATLTRSYEAVKAFFGRS